VRCSLPTRHDLYGVAIPAGIGKVAVDARDREFGCGGRKLEVKVPGR
jgi:hypothetical protein